MPVLSKRKCCCSAGVACSPCSIPAVNLTLHYTNTLYGSGTETLVWSGVNQWTTGCFNNARFQLLCFSGGVAAQFLAFLSGPCPNTASSNCTTLGSFPGALAITLAQCSPFLYRFGTSGCAAATSGGYSLFEVTL